MRDTVIQVNNLGKRYRLGGQAQLDCTLPETLAKKAGQLRDTLLGRTPAKQLENANDFWALRNISFDLKQGEVLGIIGHNGSGKSTLLKMLSNITNPTEGTARIRGRVASLLEVGTGFHPELSGRENIFLNGTILGMTRKEIKTKLNDIIEFSGIEQFLDTPVKRYSSGMTVRLAFAVAAHLEPEILVIDEVLAVGDAEFQDKCLGKMNKVANSGRTILFISHNMNAVRQLCTRSIWLNRGHMQYDGDVSECIDLYLDAKRRRTGKITDHVEKQHHEVTLELITVNNDDLDRVNLPADKQNLYITLTGHNTGATKRMALEARLFDAKHLPLATYSIRHLGLLPQVVENGHFTLQANIALPEIASGQYYLSLMINDPGKTSWAYLPMAVGVHAEGHTSSCGLAYPYNSGNGFILLKAADSVHALEQAA
jgi:lipopolysaccharide transport system ATP-binding protein